VVSSGLTLRQLTPAGLRLAGAGLCGGRRAHDVVLRREAQRDGRRIVPTEQRHSDCSQQEHECGDDQEIPKAAEPRDLPPALRARCPHPGHNSLAVGLCELLMGGAARDGLHAQTTRICLREVQADVGL
jgi:hypothetical protein